MPGTRYRPPDRMSRCGRILNIRRRSLVPIACRTGTRRSIGSWRSANCRWLHGRCPISSRRAAIIDQELAASMSITGGEMHRRTHNRHSPPNAMLNHFWQKIPAFQGATRPKPITPHDPDVFHPAATCQGAHRRDHRSRSGRRIQNGVGADAAAGEDHHDRAAYALAKVAYDEYYDDLGNDDAGSRQAVAPQFSRCWRRPAARISKSTSRCSRWPTKGRGRRRSRRDQSRHRRTDQRKSMSPCISARAITPSARNMTARSATAISTSAAIRPT